MALRVGRADRSRGKQQIMQVGAVRCSLTRMIGPRLVGIAVAAGLLWCSSAEAAGPHVLLLRGLFGVFSTGLDGIASQLKTKGITAEVAGHLRWSTAVTEIVRDRSAGQGGPIVLVGHSQGANNVIDMARELKSHNITVDLLVTLAPSSQNPIPSNVSRAINYYQAGGWGDAIVADRGFHGRISNVNLASNASISHITIDKDPKLQAEIVREIAAVVQRPREPKEQKEPGESKEPNDSKE
jgi:hypothetical protein